MGNLSTLNDLVSKRKERIFCHGSVRYGILTPIVHVVVLKLER